MKNILCKSNIIVYLDTLELMKSCLIFINWGVSCMESENLMREEEFLDLVVRYYALDDNDISREFNISFDNDSLTELREEIKLELVLYISKNIKKRNFGNSPLYSECSKNDLWKIRLGDVVLALGDKKVDIINCIRSDGKSNRIKAKYVFTIIKNSKYDIQKKEHKGVSFNLNYQCVRYDEIKCPKNIEDLTKRNEKRHMERYSCLQEDSKRRCSMILDRERSIPNNNNVDSRDTEILISDIAKNANQKNYGINKFIHNSILEDLEGFYEYLQNEFDNGDEETRKHIMIFLCSKKQEYDSQRVIELVPRQMLKKFCKKIAIDTSFHLAEKPYNTEYDDWFEHCILTREVDFSRKVYEYVEDKFYEGDEGVKKRIMQLLLSKSAEHKNHRQFESFPNMILEDFCKEVDINKDDYIEEVSAITKNDGWVNICICDQEIDFNRNLYEYFEDKFYQGNDKVKTNLMLFLFSTDYMHRNIRPFESFPISSIDGFCEAINISNDFYLEETPEVALERLCKYCNITRVDEKHTIVQKKLCDHYKITQAKFNELSRKYDYRQKYKKHLDNSVDKK